MKKVLLSVIVIVYDMPRQAMNTLRSLCTEYQQNVDAEAYEVIVVENRSKNVMDASGIASLPGNFHYFLRDEKGVSPAAAINFALTKCNGEHVCLMIDGARLITPGVIQYSLMACRITPEALVIVPGYHLGPLEHHLLTEATYSEKHEQEELRRVGWPENGYAVFSMSCLSGSNRHGFFHPFMECNCLVVRKKTLLAMGGADERFDLPGGGALNLYIYRKLARHPETTIFLLPGEGSFHQQHGGVSTSPLADRQALLDQMRDQLDALLGETSHSPCVEPILIGKIPGSSLEYMKSSCESYNRRMQRLGTASSDLFKDDQNKIALRNGGFVLED